MSFKRSRWEIRPPVTDRKVQTAPGLSSLVVQLLHNRGVTDLAMVQSFLAADSSLSYDPFLMPDMHKAVSRIYQAVLSAEHIAVYGDFDTDGITATALLVQGLTGIGAKVMPYIPHRQSEGHGLRELALKDLAAMGINLVITVDCGTTNCAEVETARKLGLDVILTDHHTPAEMLPCAFAHVNPKLPGSAYPFTELAGVGVAYKLLQGVMQSLGKTGQAEQYLDLVMLGTIADMSPLLGENRYLVKEGLRTINAHPRLGVRTIIDQVKLNVDIIETEHIAWIVAPYLNATGRMEHAMSSYRLLTTESPQEALELAALLEQKNDERKKLTSSTYAKAREQVLSQGVTPLLVVGGEDYAIGVAGLVANRLSDEFYRPSIVLEIGREMSSGSCRSIPEFNLINALNQGSHLLTQYGGHSQAAGFTLPTANLPLLQQLLTEVAAKQLDGLDLQPRIMIDAELKLRELGGETYRSMQLLAPFGQGNPYPTFITRRVEVVNCRTMGNNGGHLRLKLKQNNITWNGVAFGFGCHQDEATSPLDIVYNLELDRWGGNELLRLNIIDFAQSDY